MLYLKKKNLLQKGLPWAYPAPDIYNIIKSFFSTFK